MQYSNHYAQNEQDAPEADDGFHDHALQELYRAFDDLSPWYSPAEMYEMLKAHAARLVAERSVAALAGLDPIPLDSKVA